MFVLDHMVFILVYKPKTNEHLCLQGPETHTFYQTGFKNKWYTFLSTDETSVTELNRSGSISDVVPSISSNYKQFKPGAVINYTNIWEILVIFAHSLGMSWYLDI